MRERTSAVAWRWRARWIAVVIPACALGMATSVQAAETDMFDGLDRATGPAVAR